MRPTAPTAMSLLTGAMVRETTTPAVVAPPPAMLASSKDMEVAASTFDALASTDQTIGLARQWSALDVFVSLERAVPAIASGGIIGVKVYAVTQASGRVLVATGAVLPRPFASDAFLPLQIAAARGEPQRYEVDVRVRTPAGTGGPKLTVTAVGTRNTAQAPGDVGALLQTDPSGSLLFGVGNRVLTEREILHFTATDLSGGGAGNERWLQYFDTSGAIPNGTVPSATWRIPDGGTLDLSPRLGRSRVAPNLRASSTAATLTNVADVFLSAIVR